MNLVFDHMSYLKKGPTLKNKKVNSKKYNEICLSENIIAILYQGEQSAQHRFP
jgi:hypothetical protein